MNSTDTHRYAVILEDALSEVTQEEFPDRHDNACNLASLFVHFKDYDHAIALNRQVVALPVQPDNERITIVSYLNLASLLTYPKGDFDASDSCYRHVLNYDAVSPIREDREEVLVVCRGGLAVNNVRRGNYAEAADSLENIINVVPPKKSVYRYHLLLYLAECYSALGRVEEAQRILPQENVHTTDVRDSLFVTFHHYVDDARVAALTGNAAAACTALDNVFSTQSHIENYNSGMLFHETVKSFYRDNIEHYAEHLRDTRRQNILLIVGIALAIIAIAVILWMYRKKNLAYISLTETNRRLAHADWTTERPDVSNVDTNTELDTQPMTVTLPEPSKPESDIRTFIETHKVYLDAEYTADRLAHDMGINRTYLSRLISPLAPNFNTLINAYRVRYAQLLLEKDAALSIDTLSTLCGFNNRRTFGNAFRNVTGLTPSDYRSRLTPASQSKPIDE